jgi:WhiB family transcriptional regulator, redox-sensing transcriptional regulator
MTATGSTQNWRSAAACRSVDPDLFFPISGTGPAVRQIARAKTICAGCGVRRECLEFALAHGQSYGIWGGTTAEDRQRTRRRRRRAATAAGKRTVAALSSGEPAFHAGQELVGVDGLGHVVAGAGRDALLPVAGHGAGDDACLVVVHIG